MAPEIAYFNDKWWVSPYNFLDEVRSQFSLPQRVTIHDVTLRDGEQAPNVAFTKDEKIRMAQALDEMGIPRLEIYPMVSKDDAEAAREIANLKLTAKVLALARVGHKEDVDLAIDCDLDGIVLEGDSNPKALPIILNWTHEQFVDQMVEDCTYAKEHGLYTACMPWDTFRAGLDPMKYMYGRAIREGHTDSIVVADTFGQGLPTTVTYIIRTLKSWFPDTPVEMHAHNDFGLATSTMISAVCGGASVVHTCMNTLGERSGNASTQEVVMALKLLLGIDTGVKLDRIYETTNLIAQMSKITIPANQPIIGDNLFTIESGLIIYMFNKLRQKGLELGFLPFSPEVIGRENRINFVLGKKSGLTAVEIKLKEMGLQADSPTIERICDELKREGMLRKGVVPESEFRRRVHNIMGLRKS